MKITEAQLRRIIRNIILESKHDDYRSSPPDDYKLSPTDEYHPSTAGKTSHVDPIATAREILDDKERRRKEELKKMGLTKEPRSTYIKKDTVLRAKEIAEDNVRRREEELRQQGLKEFADEIQAAFDEAFKVFDDL